MWTAKNRQKIIKMIKIHEFSQCASARSEVSEMNVRKSRQSGLWGCNACNRALHHPRCSGLRSDTRKVQRNLRTDSGPWSGESLCAQRVNVASGFYSRVLRGIVQAPCLLFCRRECANCHFDAKKLWLGHIWPFTVLFLEMVHACFRPPNPEASPGWKQLPSQAII